MKNGKIKILVFSLILFIAAMMINININNISEKHTKSSQNTAILSPESSDFWEMSNITIDDDGGTYGSLTWAEAETKEWCIKVGGVYLIENITINAGFSGDGILIKDSNAPFIIRNCTVKFAQGSAYDYGGIKLNNTNNGTITKSDFSHNQGTGILLVNTCQNITISNNVIINNTWYGICLRDGCDENILFNNTVNDDDGSSQYNGIYLNNDCNSNIISNNTLNKNNQYGIRVFSSHNIVIANNSIDSQTSTDRGIYLQNSYDTIVSANDMYGCGLYIQGSTILEWTHNIATNNTLNGKALYYYMGESGLNDFNLTEDGEPAQVILAQCSNSEVSNYDLSGGSLGVQLYDCENITISNNTIIDNKAGGIRFDYNCINNTIFNNTIDSYAENQGIYFQSSCNDNNISENKIIGNFYGIYFRINCDNNDIINNTIIQNQAFGIYFWGTHDNNRIINNTIYDNSGDGMWLRDHCNGNEIKNNIIKDNNGVGLCVREYCTGNTIMNNQIQDTVAGSTQTYGIMLTDESNENLLANNTINDHNLYGIQIQDNCDSNNITGNIASDTGAATQNAGIRIMNHCKNNLIYKNTANGNEQYGIYLYNDCDENQIVNNTTNENGMYGVFLQDYCDNNTISRNVARNIGTIDQHGGIRLSKDCMENVIEWNNLSENIDSGIALFDNCNDNEIRHNNASFNGKAGIELNASNSNTINNNLAKNNTYGLLLNSSSYNCIYDNILIQNDYNYNESGICIGNGDCRTSSTPTPEEDDDDDDDDDDDIENLAIPLGKTYLIFIILSLITLIIIRRKKLTQN